MSDVTFDEFLAQVDNFSYEQKKSLLERLKASLKHKKQKEFKIRLAKGKKIKTSIVDSLVGICPYPKPPYDDDPKMERIMTKYESLV